MAALFTVILGLILSLSAGAHKSEVAAELRSDGSETLMRHQGSRNELKQRQKRKKHSEPAESDDTLVDDYLDSEASVPPETAKVAGESSSIDDMYVTEMDGIISNQLDYLSEKGILRLDQVGLLLGVKPPAPPPPPVKAVDPCEKVDTSVPQILVLSTNDRDGRARIQALQTSLSEVSSSGIKRFGIVHGLDYESFSNEADMMHASGFEIDEKAQTQWSASRIRRGLDLKPTLACALGHRQLWKRAASACPGVWTVILEDDVRPLGPKVAAVLAKVPPGSHQAFLDGRHCKGFHSRHWHMETSSNGFVVKGAKPGANYHLPWSAAAYALRPQAAKALLEAPFNDNLDFLLNNVLSDGSVTAFCPGSWEVPFSAEYDHPSNLKRGSASYNPSIFQDMWFSLLNALSELTGKNLLGQE